MSMVLCIAVAGSKDTSTCEVHKTMCECAAGKYCQCHLMISFFGFGGSRINTESDGVCIVQILHAIHSDKMLWSTT